MDQQLPRAPQADLDQRLWRACLAPDPEAAVAALLDLGADPLGHRQALATMRARNTDCLGIAAWRGRPALLQALADACPAGPGLSHGLREAQGILAASGGDGQGRRPPESVEQDRACAAVIEAALGASPHSEEPAATALSSHFRSLVIVKAQLIRERASPAPTARGAATPGLCAAAGFPIFKLPAAK